MHEIAASLCYILDPAVQTSCCFIETDTRLNCRPSSMKRMSPIDMNMMIATDPEGVANIYFSKKKPGDALCAKKVFFHVPSFMTCANKCVSSFLPRMLKHMKCVQNVGNMQGAMSNNADVLANAQNTSLRKATVIDSVAKGSHFILEISWFRTEGSCESLCKSFIDFG